MSFKDHFSTQASDYAQYRPHYPPALFAYLASLVREHQTAWDCATGNGQAALELAPYFERVIATDPSTSQIAHAVKHEKINYLIATAEHTDILTHSVDLITVAQALHWFDCEKFYTEARRVLKPGGVLAVWCYNLLQCTPGIDAILHEFYFDVVGSFWPPERKLLEEDYRSIPFPFEEIAAPRFSMATQWDLKALTGYLRTWSATQRFIAQNNVDPVADVAQKLEIVWGSPRDKKIMRWPLFLRVGRQTHR